MSVKRQVKPFRYGTNQTVRTLCKFEIPGNDHGTPIRGEQWIVEPVPPVPLLAVLAAVASTDEELPETGKISLNPVELKSAACPQSILFPI